PRTCYPTTPPFRTFRPKPVSVLAESRPVGNVSRVFGQAFLLASGPSLLPVLLAAPRRRMMWAAVRRSCSVVPAAPLRRRSSLNQVGSERLPKRRGGVSCLLIESSFWDFCSCASSWWRG